MSQTIQRYGVRRRRDWRNPFSWFNWYWRDRPTVLYKYQPMGGNEHGATTFTRASTATYVTEGGVVASAASGATRDRHYINGRGPYTLLEGSRQNALTYAQDLSNAAWTPTGLTSRTLNATGPDGAANSANTFVENSGASVHGVLHSANTISADTAQSILGHFKANGRTKVRFGLTDNTANSFSVDCDLSAVTATPVLAGAGVVTGSRIYALTNGWYRVEVWGKVNGGATNGYVSVLHLNAAGSVSYTGDGASGILVYGIQHEIDKAFPSSYIPTVAAAVTRSADALSFPFLPVPQAMTGYTKINERGNILDVGNGSVVLLGTTAGNYLYLDVSAGGKYQLRLYNGTATATATLAVAPTIGDTVELRWAVASTGALMLGQSINGAAETTATASAPSGGLPTAWDATTITLNSRTGGSVVGYNAFARNAIASGVQTMDVMRSL